MQFLNGKIIAKQIRAGIQEYILHLPQVPGLAVILVGTDPASHLYVSLKEKACQETGIKFERFLFPDFVKEEELLKKINELNNRTDINGILIQLPLPNQNADKIIAAIEPKKDVDGFHPENLRCLEAGKPCLVSPVVLGVMHLIKEARETLTKKKAILIMSQLFAHPFEIILSREGIGVETISPDDPELTAKTKNSDLLITAVGRPSLITGEMIKPGAIVIDIGTTRINDKVVGDVESSSVEIVAGWLTPVPGGVGPMTVAMLLKNVLEAQKNQSFSNLKKSKNNTTGKNRN